MSVVTVAHGGRSALAFVKGSPEMVASLCRADTVPPQFSSTLRSFSSEGLRVLALACKPVDMNSDLMNIERAEVEKELKFLGLLIMKNQVKPETAGVIDVLTEAHIRTVMVTGDNILTAVNVAKSCRMIGSDEKVIFVTATPQTAQSVPTLRFSLDNEGAPNSTDVTDQERPGYHLAIDGRSFSALCDHFPDYLPKVLMKATIFARMLPDQKAQMVMELQKLNYCVGMCG
ncbi:probable cation-transporting ATPase 13A2, partial [Austrofundulus limnaeus]|uniref:Probable cation-transporting ATPase 13A2 n=1 Tax=Austrofundulus limnaeus TaxID=52670 RepID=A0A2I4AM20_AUSLI